MVARNEKQTESAFEAIVSQSLEQFAKSTEELFAKNDSHTKELGDLKIEMVKYRAECKGQTTKLAGEMTHHADRTVLAIKSLSTQTDTAVETFTTANKKEHKAFSTDIDKLNKSTGSNRYWIAYATGAVAMVVLVIQVYSVFMRE